jgi:RecA/RadA recombinase
MLKRKYLGVDVDTVNVFFYDYSLVWFNPVQWRTYKIKAAEMVNPSFSYITKSDLLKFVDPKLQEPFNETVEEWSEKYPNVKNLVMKNRTKTAPRISILPNVMANKKIKGPGGEPLSIAGAFPTIVKASMELKDFLSGDKSDLTMMDDSLYEDGLWKLVDYFASKGIHVDPRKAILTRVDLNKNLVLEIADGDQYFALLKLMIMKHQKKIYYHQDGTISFKNSRIEIIFYNKNKQMKGRHKLNNEYINLPNFRIEIRLKKSGLIEDNELTLIDLLEQPARKNLLFEIIIANLFPNKTIDNHGIDLSNDEIILDFLKKKTRKANLWLDRIRTFKNELATLTEYGTRFELRKIKEYRAKENFRGNKKTIDREVRKIQRDDNELFSKIFEWNLFSYFGINPRIYNEFVDQARNVDDPFLNDEKIEEIAKRQFAEVESKRPRWTPPLAPTFPNGVLATGLPSFDRLFEKNANDGSGGGIPRGSIASFAGDSGIGKSHLLLQIAKNVLSSGRSVLYLDIDRGLNRKTILGFKLIKSERMKFAQPSTFREIEDLLTAARNGKIHFDLIVIDSLDAILTDEMFEDNEKVTARYLPGEKARRETTFLSFLKQYCLTMGSIAIYSNQLRVKKIRNGKYKDGQEAGGVGRKYHTDFRLRLSKTKAIFPRQVAQTEKTIGTPIPIGHQIGVWRISEEKNTGEIVNLRVIYGKEVTEEGVIRSETRALSTATASQR